MLVGPEAGVRASLELLKPELLSAPMLPKPVHHWLVQSRTRCSWSPEWESVLEHAGAVPLVLKSPEFKPRYLAARS